MSNPFVEFFRQSAPYIHSYRGKTAVVLLGGEPLSQERLYGLVSDLALLSSLGLKLVLVQGARQQIDQALQEAGLPDQQHQGLRVTDAHSLELVMAVSGAMRHQLEAAFSRGIVNSPMFNAQVRLISGNFVNAKPLGVLDGIDMQHTGLVRSVAADSIKQLLQTQGQMVLISHLGYSVTGEIFNLRAEEVAIATAKAIAADKLIVLGARPDPGIFSASEYSLDELQALMAQCQPTDEGWAELQLALEACSSGIPRCHLLNNQDGHLLLELYTRDGAGLMVMPEHYDRLRQASLSDINGILALLEPLEAKGILVQRPRERLEQEIEHFTVIERDGFIIACAALYPFVEDAAAELACLVVHPDYRNSGRAERLLKHIGQQLVQQGLTNLFVLTTQTAHWFAANGFVGVPVSSLPAKRQQLYNWQRNSKVYWRQLV